MSFVTIGDLSRTFLLRSSNSEIKARLTRLGEEMASGQTADPAARVRGDFRPVAALERSLSLLDAYDVATDELTLAADSTQAALEQLTNMAQSLGPDLLDMSITTGANGLQTLAFSTRQALDQAVAALNTSVAGRSLFAGSATDTAPLAGSDAIFAAVAADVAGMTTAPDVLAAVDAWFDTPGGGFETVAYQGAGAPAGPVRVADGQNMRLEVTAADPEIRNLLKGLVLGALLTDDTILAGNAGARAELGRAAGERLIAADAQVIGRRAEVGLVQERIETVRTGNAASRDVLTMARSRILEVDPYETATALKATETQLETLYAITARLSRLSLADYI